MSEPNDRKAFRQAAHRSIVADATVRPGLVEHRAEHFMTEILQARMARALRSQWVDAIIGALRSDILASKRHA